ncbi:ORF6N domain-containing protein [Candidatus Poribacteria bacterium]|nr:ORF6N domain-containing protein [Candidatus Poribacteria bacterium]
MAKKAALIPSERIERLIIILRGQKVMLSADLAELYGVETRVLAQAVKRNIERFPQDFMFQLTWEETRFLRSQSVTLNEEPGSILRSQSVILKQGAHLKYRPYAFTEQGVAMLSSVLNSPRAINVNIEIMRAFVRLRQMLASHADLARKLEALERKYDAQFKVVFEAIRQLMAPQSEKAQKRVGFQVGTTPKSPREKK